MPQVPGLVPTAVPSSQGAPEVNVSAPVEAFGGAVGHALSGLGQAVEGVGDKIWQRAVEIQNLANETEAKNADAQYMMKAGELHANYSSLEGVSAKAAFPKYMEDLQSLRTSIRSGMSNDMARKMYDSSSLSVMGRTIFNGAGHAAQQMKVAANNASSARVDQMINGVADTPTDEVSYQRYTQGIRSEVESQGRNNGWMPDQIKATADAKISQATAGRIAALSKTDVFGAQKMLDTAVKAGTLRELDSMKVQATVQTQFRQVGSRMISDEVMKGRREGEDNRTEAELLAEADTKAQKYSKDDPLFQDFVRYRVMADYRRQKSVERDDRQMAEQTIIEAMNTGNKEGILPKSVDELKAIHPDVESAWDRIGEKRQNTYNKVFAENAIGEPRAWTPDSIKQFQMLKGLAQTNPVEFLAHDISQDGLPVRGQQRLVQIQKSLRKDLQTDPRVGRALNILSGSMTAAGIDRKVRREDYDQFVGALADQLDEFQHEKKRSPTVEEVQTIGKQLMDEHVSSVWDRMFGGDKTYQLPVPEKDVERIKTDPRWTEIGVKPTDYWIKRQYHREQFNELYKGKGKTSE